MLFSSSQGVSSFSVDPPSLSSDSPPSPFTFTSRQSEKQRFYFIIFSAQMVLCRNRKTVNPQLFLSLRSDKAEFYCDTCYAHLPAWGVLMHKQHFENNISGSNICSRRFFYFF